MPKRVIYLIRNAEYNREALDEENNAPLTERGVEQAQRTASAVKDLPIETIYTSPHAQTGSTANIIRNALDEPNFYASEELKQYHNASVSKTFTRELLIKAMENNTVDSQIDDAFKRFFQPATDADIHEALICHGNIILDLVCRATQVNPETWSHMLINNCAISIVAIESAEDMQLVAFNDVRHLPDRLRTE